METGVVEAVSTKFANKYNSGAVKIGGVWLNVVSKLPITAFKQDTEVTFETKTNDKGYRNIVALGETPTETVVEKPKRAKKEIPVEELHTKTYKENIKDPVVKSYEDNKNRRILVQGLTQSCMASPATINFGSEPTEIAAKVFELADLLIAGVEQRF